MIDAVRNVHLAPTSARRTWSTSPRPAAVTRRSMLGLSPRATLQLAARRAGPRRGPGPRLRHARRRQGRRPCRCSSHRLMLRAGSNARTSADDLVARAARRRPRPGRPLAGAGSADSPGLDRRCRSRRRRSSSGACSRSSSCSSSAPALGLAVGTAVLAVALPPPAAGDRPRWIHPTVLTVGDTGRVDLLIENRGKRRSPPVDLSEPVGPNSTAQMAVASLPSGARVTAGYRVPACVAACWSSARRCSAAATCSGLPPTAGSPPGRPRSPSHRRRSSCRCRRSAAACSAVTCSRSQRIGPGEFHSLRNYVTGDEPRSIHWRASARSEELKVRQHEARGRASLHHRPRPGR